MPVIIHKSRRQEARGLGVPGVFSSTRRKHRAASSANAKMRGLPVAVSELECVRS